jgi:Asp-tRNA(Asn)/Glu-tRNA(Gln) amidotransferase A subunit family amidase
MNRSAHALDFAKARARFLTREDDPREYLERCIATISARDADVRAFVTLGLDAARRAADASAQRYRSGKPLSAVDGMPIGVKDIMDTADLPTQMGSPIYAGWQPRWDAACVHALRSGGAVVVGKTVTTAFACGATNQTRNPLDPRRTPGGSSSGSGAAVGAGMLPAGLGTQTQGSTLRPASYCGVVGFKPTHGALTMQGVHPISFTHDHLGVIGGTLEDTWCVASHVSVVGGHPGAPGLQGASAVLPEARKPKKLIVLLTPAWKSEVEAPARNAFEALLEGLRRRGIELITREDDAQFAALEDAFFSSFVDRSVDITSYEMKWPFAAYAEREGEKLEKRVHDRLARAAEMTPAYYAELLAEKAHMKARAEKIMGDADAMVTLSASGPAPLGHEHTGSRTYLLFATFLGLPAFSLPLMEADGMPLGAQLIGHAGRDGELCGIASGLLELAKEDAPETRGLRGVRTA